MSRAIALRHNNGDEARVTIIQSGCGLQTVAAAAAGAQVIGSSGWVLAELLLQALGMERVPGLVDIAGELATQNKQSACVTNVRGDSRKLQVPRLDAPYLS